jgi:hypothetical protein
MSESDSKPAKQAAARRARQFWAEHGQYDVIDLTEEQEPEGTE